jgi:hypothetical protein
MSERSERIIETVRFAQWCTVDTEQPRHADDWMVHQ